ncbi:hypothetical protein [Campylobacter californiensis]|uniref:hypothetical protein n=1 Tax=Campylobacter californiensis TaxID=1032243 RepID=UPI001451B0D9|nr:MULTISPECIES: hypothetical protein [unclassified Campylobacter]MBE2985334.1 hypothetical protein [Campylobacter sp. RM6883]MBE2995867.1 hypothetical protein [Campylobacter sp. RM6913]MBE3610512.1 hypothetical protein [Campylobacter sp. RM12916]QCD51243.1 putative membrane protein [Campylobacter sp. RM6914]
MGVSLSKSFMGLRFTYRPTREKQPTQAELARADKEHFLNKVKHINDNCLFDFIKKCGYSEKTILFALNSNMQVVDFIQDTRNYEIFQNLTKINGELDEIISKTEFSNVLTGKRREVMTDYVFEIFKGFEQADAMYSDNAILQKIAEKQGKTYKEIEKEQDKHYKDITTRKLSWWQKICYTIAFLITAPLALISWGTAITQDNKMDTGAAVFAVVIFSLPFVVTCMFYRRSKKIG